MRWADQAYGIKFVALRYFNVAGAKPDGSIGEDHGPETHLLPIVLQVAQGKRAIRLLFLAMITILWTGPMYAIMSILSTWLTPIFWLLITYVQVNHQKPLTLALRLVFPTFRL